MAQQQQEPHSHCDDVTTTTLSPNEVTSIPQNEKKNKKKNNQQETSTYNKETDHASSSKEEVNITEGDQQEQYTTTTDATACDDDQNEKQDQDQQDEVRRLIAKGLLQLSHQERSQIEEEVHGIQSMGLSQGDEAKPHIKALFLRQFKDHLGSTLILARKVKDEANAKASPSSSSSTNNKSTITPNTDVYELCLRKNYTYAINETGSLRLICLRAVLWNPKKACTRFLNHINALHKYYGDAGLKQPLTIDRLDFEEVNNPISIDADSSNANSKSNPYASRGIYKNGNGSCKRKGSLETLPDMLELKSGIAQVLPSRDRSGRRVIFLQPAGLSIDSHPQTQQQHHSKVG